MFKIVHVGVWVVLYSLAQVCYIEGNLIGAFGVLQKF